MRRGRIRFYEERSLRWKILHFFQVHFEFYDDIYGATDAANLARIYVDITNAGVGPNASIKGREDALRILTKSPTGVFSIGLLVAFVLASLLGLLFGREMWGDAFLLGMAIMFPIAGLPFPLAVRWTRAQSQLKAWRKRGEPEGEQPIDGSLPGVLDTIIGLSLGGYFSAFFIYDVFWG